MPSFNKRFLQTPSIGKNLLCAARKLKRSLVDLLYPPLCLHCHVLLPDHYHLFCPCCVEEMDPIDPAGRCRYCFCSCPEEIAICRSCRERPSLLRGYGAVFEEIGPAATLLQQLKLPGGAYFAQGAGGYMVSQLLRLNFPIPHFIVPVPLSFTHWLVRGFNQSERLANAIGQIVDRPVRTPLKRRSGHLRQQSLTRSQREALSIEGFCLEQKELFQEQTLLLVDDTYHTGATLQRCAEMLAEGLPDRIYALTLCHASL